MRSPMCEALFNREITGIQTQRFTVVSAGLNAVPGRAAHSWAISAAKEFGISLDSHRAQLLTPEMVARADAIFVMDFENLAQLLSRWPGAKSKVFLLGGYAHGEDRSVEIYDPYYLGLEGTERSYRTLSVCIQKLARWLLE